MICEIILLKILGKKIIYLVFIDFVVILKTRGKPLKMMVYLYYNMSWLLRKLGFKNFLTKIKILLHFNLIVIKIKMQ